MRKKQADEKETAEAMRRLGKEFEKGLAEDLEKAAEAPPPREETTEMR